MSALSRGLPFWGGLPPVVRGIVWMTLAAFFFACMFAFVRKLSLTFTVFEVMFYRAAIGMALMWPTLLGGRWVMLRTRRIGLYGFRTIAVYIAMTCLFYGMAHLPLALATSLYFLVPLFTVLFSAWTLAERVGLNRWVAILIGFAGALIIIRPGAMELSLPVIAVLVTAVSLAAGNTAIRALTRTEPTGAVLIYDFILTLPIAAIPAVYFWTMPGWDDLPWILGFGVLGTLGQQCFIRSLAAAPASAVMPPYYLQLPFVALFAFLWFGEVPAIWTWIGATVICASTYYIAWRESRQHRRRAADTASDEETPS